MKRLIISLIALFSIGFVFAVDTNSQATPWSRDKAYHLASKTLFSPRKNIVDQLYSAGSAAAAVNILFPDPVGPDKSNYYAQINAITGTSIDFFSNTTSVEQLYLYRFYKDPYEAKSKLFQNFEDIFSVARNGDGSITYKDIWNQYDLIYSHSLGNYKTMVKRIMYNNGAPGDYAMGKYLDLLDMNRNSPNENYARELLQLFLMGENLPYDKIKSLPRNYTEADVAALAKLITGFRSSGHSVYYSSADHNNSANISFLTGSLKTGDSFSFYNTTNGIINSSLIPTSINGNNGLGDNVIDYIFSKREDAIALFLADKLFRFYVHDNPNQAQLEYLAGIIKVNNFELFPTIRTLLVSDFFYADESMNGIIYKNPLDIMVGTSKLLEKDSSKVFKSIFDNGVLNSLGRTSYQSPSIFGRPGFDQNSLFWGSDTLNQWISFSTKFGYGSYNVSSISSIRSSLDSLLGSGSVSDYSIEDFVNMYVDLTGSINIKTSGSNTYSGNIDLGNGSISYSGNIVNFSNGNVSFPNMALSIYSGINLFGTINLSGTIDLNTRKINILSGTFLTGSQSNTIISGDINIIGNPVIKRDVNIDEFIGSLEIWLLAGKSLPQSIKTSLKNYLLTDSTTNLQTLVFSPNNQIYKNSKIKGAVSFVLSQPEFVLKSGHDKAQIIDSSSSSIFSSNTPKFVIVYLGGGYDWLDGFVKKTDYQTYQSYRPNIAPGVVSSSSPYFYELNQDWYASSYYSNLKPLFDAGEGLIFNRVGAPNHSRAHDDAFEWVSSNEEDADLNTPGLVGNLIKDEPQTSNVFAISSSKPFLYNGGKFIKVIGNSSFNFNNYSSLAASEKTLLINTLTGVFSQRVYPGNLSMIYNDTIKLDQISKTAKNVLGRTGPGWNTKDQLDYVKMLMNNNIGKIYYLSRGGYDTHNNQRSALTFHSGFINDVIDFYNSAKTTNPVVVMMYSEFGRTNRENGSRGTDHGKGGGIILLTNIRSTLGYDSNIYGDIQLNKEVDNYLSVGIDYRTIWGKIFTTLYGTNQQTFFGKSFELSDYIDTISPKIIIRKNEFQRISTTRTNMILDILLDDKNFSNTEGSYIEFRYGTNPSSLSSASRYTIDNTYKQSSNTYRIVLNNLNHNSNYYYVIKASDNNYNQSTYTGTIFIPQILRGRTISSTRHSILYDYNTIFVNNYYSLSGAGVPLNLAVNVGTGYYITGYNGIKLHFSTGTTQVLGLVSSGTNSWNGGFLLPMELGTGNYINPGARFGNRSFSNLNVKKLIKIGADSPGIGMRLSKNVRINIPGPFSSNNYSIIYSEDGLLWSGLNTSLIQEIDGSLSFDTDKFSYFALITTDDVPNQFYFTDKNGVVPGVMIESDPITITGIDTQSMVNIFSGEYSIFTGTTWSSWTNSTGYVTNTNLIKVRGIAPNSGTKNIKLTVGGVYDFFDISPEQSGGSGGGGGGGGGGGYLINLAPQYKKMVEIQESSIDTQNVKIDAEQLSKVFDAIKFGNKNVLQMDEAQKSSFYSGYNKYSFHQKLLGFVQKTSDEKLEKAYMFFLICYEKYKSKELSKQDFKVVIEKFIDMIKSTKSKPIILPQKKPIQKTSKQVDPKNIETIWLPIIIFDNKNVEIDYKKINQEFENFKEKLVSNVVYQTDYEKIISIKKDLEYYYLEWDRLETKRDYVKLKSIKNKIEILKNTLE